MFSAGVLILIAGGATPGLKLARPKHFLYANGRHFVLAEIYKRLCVDAWSLRQCQMGLALASDMRCKPMVHISAEKLATVLIPKNLLLI